MKLYCVIDHHGHCLGTLSYDNVMILLLPHHDDIVSVAYPVMSHHTIISLIRLTPIYLIPMMSRLSVYIIEKAMSHHHAISFIG